MRHLELMQEGAAANAVLIRTVTFPDGTESTLHQGDIATGVVLAVQDTAVTVAVEEKT